MNAAPWIGDMWVSQSDAVLLIAKLTTLLAVAWLLELVLRRANPRWRVLTWRATAAGAVLLAALAVCPPLVTLSVLPPTEASLAPPSTAAEVSPVAENQVESMPTLPLPREIRPRHTAEHAVSVTAPVASQTVLRPNSQQLSLPTYWALTAIWLTGVLAGIGFTAVGLWRLADLRRHTKAVPVQISAVGDQVADDLGLHRTFELRQTTEVVSPCIVGVWRPTILLPERQCGEEFATELPAILAHELAHLRGSDLIWNHLLSAMSTFMWFHPLAWRVRAAHANACDGVCDAIAADYVGDAHQYGETLARLTLRITSPYAVAGLAMARKSGVRQRIEAVQRYVFRAALPRRRVASAIAIAVVAITLLGGLTLTQLSAESPAAQPVAAPVAMPAASHATRTQQVVATPATEPTDKLTFRAVSAESNQPLAGVNLKIWGGMNGKRFKTVVRTDAEGRAEFDHDPAAVIDNFSITATKSGFVPIGGWLRDDHFEIELPAHLELQFQKGLDVGGIIRDEVGKPIEGAEVELGMTITWPDLEAAGFTPFKMKTGADGRWQCDGAPQNTGQLSVRVSHTDYMPASTSTAQPNHDHLTVLKQGLKVTGRVTDESGKPIAGASALLGFDRFASDVTARTDADGRFVLKNAKAGRSLVTVTADGFSPTFQKVTVGDNTEPLDFQLKPGQTLRVRIVDVDGKPLAGVWFASDTWRGYRALSYRVNSSADGLIEWTGAPPDTVLYDMGKQGYMASRQVGLQAGGREHVITLHRPLEVSGRVTDARTRKPIEAFVVRHGQKLTGSDRNYWSRDEAISFANTGGKYRYSFDEPSVAWMLQVEAPGYQPANSRQFKSDEGQVTYDFELEPGQGPQGIVVLPDGSPAVGAEVCLATEEKRAFFDCARIDQRQNRADLVTTDSEGRFSFGPQGDEPFMVFALHDEGYADVTEEELKQNDPLILKPWGAIEGQVLLGQEPDGNREVVFTPVPANASHRPNWKFLWGYGYEANTDQQGHFRFDRVIPGGGTLSRIVIVEFPNGGRTHYPGWNRSIAVQPHQTTNITIGGTGRPITGRVTTDRQPSVELDWTTNEPAELVGWDKAKGQRSQDHARYLGRINRSGAFTIPDVPAGDYRLIVNVNTPPLPNTCGAGESIGKAEFDATVPEMPGGRSDAPLDVGTVTATLFDTLEPGELTPDFAVAQLDGGTLRMTDLEGKLVLLDFWATWCQPCIAEMPVFQEIQEQFGGDKRFALVSVSCDNDASLAREFVASKDYRWQQVQIPGTTARMAQDYTVRALPATYLIGPNGRVLAVNLRGEPLKQALAAALADESLFNEAATVRPPRFPVVHFKVPSESQPLPKPPAVVIADDTDPNFEQDKPHTDGLRLLAADGQVLWAHNDLNNCQSVGGMHGVAIDRQRGRIYVRELVAKRLSAYNFQGEKLWQMDKSDADTVAVDPQTGNLWTSGGPDLSRGETIIFDAQGNELAVYPQRGIDVEYDPHSDAFWLVGYEIVKLSRTGDVLFRRPVDGWCCPSLSVNPTDGSVWIVERDHPDKPRSKNRLWLLAADGSVRHEIDLGEQNVFAVACIPDTGEAWLGSFGAGLRRVTPEGEIGKPLPVEAHAFALSPSSGDLWISNDAAVQRLDRAGQVQITVPFRSASSQAWLAAF